MQPKPTVTLLYICTKCGGQSCNFGISMIKEKVKFKIRKLDVATRNGDDISNSSRLLEVGLSNRISAPLPRVRLQQLPTISFKNTKLYQ